MRSSRPTPSCWAFPSTTTARPARSRPGSTTWSLQEYLDAQTNAGLLRNTEFIVLAARGGGYGPGTPREGWDHAEPWLRHALSATGLEPRFITVELTMASSNPAMADLIPLAADSLVRAEAAIDELWSDLQCVA